MSTDRPDLAQAWTAYYPHEGPNDLIYPYNEALLLAREVVALRVECDRLQTVINNVRTLCEAEHRAITGFSGFSLAYEVLALLPTQEPTDG